jgi:hypothetical protein
MEEFNLERALAGEPVCTRDGNEVTQLTYFEAPKDLFSVVGVLKNEVYCWQTNGRFLQTQEDAKDLFIKPKEKVIWVNVYKSVRGFLFLGHQFDTEEEAIDDAKGESIFVKRLRITDKPDTI